MAADFHFFQRIFTEVNTALSTYVNDVASNIIASITPVATTLLMIYVMLWGWSIMRGMISEPITDGVTRLIRLSVIYALALTIGNYNGYIADLLWNSPDAIASYVASGYSDSSNNSQFLDSLISKLYDFGDAFWQKANATGGWFPDIGLLLTAILIWVAGLIATAYGAFLLILSKMALAILLGVGPIFVLLLIFEGSKKFFEAWLGQALNYVFLVMLTASSIKLILTILQKYLGDASGLVADPSVSQALPAIAICVIGALVMMQLSSIAAALGGGAAISTLGASGWAYDKATGKALGIVAGMRPTTMRRNLNRLKADKDITIAAAKWAVGRSSSSTKAVAAPKSRSAGGG